MNFYENMFSTFIGALAGFVFSIILFYLTNKWKEKDKKKNLRKNLLKELDYDLIYLTDILSDINKVVEKIGINAPEECFIFLKYSGYQSLFLNIYFREGFLYESISSDEIKKLDEILSQMSLNTETFVNNWIFEWKQGKLGQKEIHSNIIYQKEKIESYIKTINQLKAKI